MSFTLIGKHEKDSRANRDGYVEAMLEMMAENPKLMHVDCDLMGCINTGKLLKAFPAQTFNAGIAEQNAMGVASGMAATGLTVFAHSFGCFAARRMFDQAFLAAGYSELPVHVIGSAPGVCAAFNGATHMPFEDCALYMTIPNAVVIDSCDFVQTKALTKKLAACGGGNRLHRHRREPSGRLRPRLCHHQPDERKESGSGRAHRPPEPLRSGRPAGFPHAAVQPHRRGHHGGGSARHRPQIISDYLYYALCSSVYTGRFACRFCVCDFVRCVYGVGQAVRNNVRVLWLLC